MSKLIPIEQVNKLHYMWMESWCYAIQGLNDEDFAVELIREIHALGAELGLDHYNHSDNDSLGG